MFLNYRCTQSEFDIYYYFCMPCPQSNIFIVKPQITSNRLVHSGIEQSIIEKCKEIGSLLKSVCPSLKNNKYFLIGNIFRDLYSFLSKTYEYMNTCCIYLFFVKQFNDQTICNFVHKMFLSMFVHILSF